MVSIIIGVSISSNGAVLFLSMPNKDVGVLDTLRMVRNSENVVIELKLLSGSQKPFTAKSLEFWRQIARAYWQSFQNDCPVEDTEDGNILQSVELFDLVMEKLQPPPTNRGVTGDTPFNLKRSK